MPAELPTGTVTFLFTDVEGSTKLLHELGQEGYAEALAEHHTILRAAFAAHHGVEVDTQGDAFFCVFASARDGVACAAEAQARLATTPIRVRMGLHSGEALVHFYWSSPSQPLQVVTFQNFPDGTESNFGTALASLGGGRFAAGAPRSDPILRLDPFNNANTYTIDAGTATVYDGAAQFQTTLAGPRNNLRHNFGNALASAPAGRLLVGTADSASDSVSTYNNVGSVSVYNNDLSFVGTWSNPDGVTNANAYFGHTVAEPELVQHNAHPIERVRFYHIASNA